MRKTILVILLLFLANVVFATKIVSLPEIIKPDVIEVDGDDMVIVEGASISIYSLKNFKLIKKFGKEGEGPQEFKLIMGSFGLNINIYPKYIFVNSVGKISYFTRKGEFIKEKKMSAINRMTPFQEKFVGNHMQMDPKTNKPKMGFNIYNSEGEKTKEICSHEMPMFSGQGIFLIDLLSQINPQYKTSRDRIVISGKQLFEIDIYDQEGNFLKSIKRDQKKQKLDDDDKKKLMKAYETHSLYKLFWGNIKKSIKIPDYFPPYKTFFISNQKVYVQTFKKKNDKTECLIFDVNGKYLKTSFLPLVYENIMTPYLYTIQGGKIYQLVENENEEWELRLSEIK